MRFALLVLLMVVIAELGLLLLIGVDIDARLPVEMDMQRTSRAIDPFSTSTTFALDALKSFTATATVRYIN